MSSIPISGSLLEIEKRQCELLSSVQFNLNVSYIYNPLDYAKETHEYFVKTYCPNPKIVLFLGMNPGPFGMAQNGVPFGDSTFVKNWLKIKGNVSKPMKEHPKRQIEGLNCSRSEVSGSRFWSFFENLCGQPDNFFENCYVHNYCPISMMTSSGKNITPADLKANEKATLFDICDEALCKVIQLLQTKIVVGVGKFAEARAKSVVKKYNINDVNVCAIMHPSPINPSANKGWKEHVYGELQKHGILQYMVPV